MIRLFRLHLPIAVVLIGLMDGLMLGLAAEIVAMAQSHFLGADWPGVADGAVRRVVFVGVLMAAMVAGGALAPQCLRFPAVATVRLFASVSLGAVILALVYLAFPHAAFWPMAALGAILLAFPLLAANRVLARLAIDHPKLRQRVLVLGGGPRARRVADLARLRPGLEVAAQLPWGDGGLGPLQADASLSRLSLAQRAAALQVDEIIVALEERRRMLPLADLVRLRTTGVRILDASMFIERETGRIDLRSTSPSALIFSEGFLLGRRMSAITKRSLDMAVSLSLLILLWPILLVAVIMVKLDSPGPAIFTQVRVGRYGVPFRLLKMRSMRRDAEADGQARWTQANDPRITRVGQWIRLFRIDELPQLWNVLAGQMSLVGPRPERPEFVQDLEQRIVYFAERHMVKPGITGWAQVNYHYGASLDDARAKLEYDLYYVKNVSVFLDLLILLQTVRVILSSEGAR